MRQVPHYLIIGNGRVAKHFLHYFSLLKLPVSNWHRTQSAKTLTEKIKQASHILLLISDQAIEKFIAQFLQNPKVFLIHFSGSLLTTKAYSAHPLMTFGDQLYELEHYQNIPFILEEQAPSFKKLLPGLANKHFILPQKFKAKYHALCVLSGNFSCLLWQKLFSSLEKEFKFPPSIAFPYLLQQTKNLFLNYKNALTGPLVRNDNITLKKNLAALSNDPFQDIYKNFINTYQKLKKEDWL